MAGSLYLIDGTYELFRSFFGAPSRKTIAGQEVGAIAGLLASLNVLIREEKPDYIAAATDSTIPSFRNDLYSKYFLRPKLNSDCSTLVHLILLRFI